tara:strand:+ start:5090 stop:5326 length:237 start_codon:yes stop_codon:yes gene_type:complete
MSDRLNMDEAVEDLRKRINTLRAHIAASESNNNVVNEAEHEDPPMQIMDKVEDEKKIAADKKMAEMKAMKAKLLGKKK